MVFAAGELGTGQKKDIHPTYQESSSILAAVVGNIFPDSTSFSSSGICF
jgi:hypothetical protein